MNEKEQEVLNFIQQVLEKFKDREIDILFFTSNEVRGVASGSYEGLSTLLLYNMVAYPQFKAIVDIAVQAYPVLYDKIKETVDNHKPSHEIVDNYRTDIEELVKRIVPTKTE